MFKLKRRKEEKTLSVYSDALTNTTFALAEPAQLSEMAQFSNDIETRICCFNSYTASRKSVEMSLAAWESFQAATDVLASTMNLSLSPYMVENSEPYDSDYYDCKYRSYIFGWTSHGCNYDAVELQERVPEYNSTEKKFKPRWRVEAIADRSKVYKNIETEAHFRGFMKEYMDTIRFLYEMHDFKERAQSRQSYLEGYERAQLS